MIIEATFTEVNHTLNADFGVVARGIDEAYKDGYADGVQEGQKAEWDKFWDAFQENGNRTNYESSFRYGWTNENFQPKYNIILNQKTGGYNSQQAFEFCEVKDIAGCLANNNVTIDTSQAEKLNAVFRYTKSTTLPPLDVGKCKSMLMTFYNMENLKSIELNNLQEDCVFDRTINYCYALENVRITGTIGVGSSENDILNFQYSPLTKDSLLNIIGCLKDFGEPSTSHTIILGATNLAKLTDAEKAVATQKGWNLL